MRRVSDSIRSRSPCDTGRTTCPSDGLGDASRIEMPAAAAALASKLSYSRSAIAARLSASDWSLVRSDRRKDFMPAADRRCSGIHLSYRNTPLRRFRYRTNAAMLSDPQNSHTILSHLRAQIPKNQQQDGTVSRPESEIRISPGAPSPFGVGSCGLARLGALIAPVGRGRGCPPPPWRRACRSRSSVRPNASTSLSAAATATRSSRAHSWWWMRSLPLWPA
ncbi:hypothetical protein SPHI_00420 [Sphingomonas jeddahensis]|uniref:Uncharacterized protein n=1 Tax=Sphingomonas jeddahensis TaxID=1915074 RepID=A0A1V2EY23_9SPHN|nr:hypothetical protein SPHI_00420 [Sphingomonas jeddahensis]